MKIFSRNRTPKYVIDVVLYLDSELESMSHLAASSRISHPKNVKKKLLLDSQQFAEYSDLVESVVSIIAHFNFDIVDEKQSKKSYSYYVDFFPTDENGDRWDESVRIRFRISNHANEGVDNQDIPFMLAHRFEKGESMIYTKSFSVGSVDYPTRWSVMQAVKHICTELKMGNYSSVEAY